MGSLMQDLRYAWRLMIRRPIASLVIIVVLALGIAVNGTIFTNFYSLQVRPLPFEQPDQLAGLSSAQPKLGTSRQGISPLDLRDWRRENVSFEEIGAYTFRYFNLQTEEAPERVEGASVSASLFPIMGVRPILGRGFTAEEDRAGGPRVVLIGYDVWQRRFGGDSKVIGRTLRLDDRVHEVVGVMPARFGFPVWHEIWTPLALDVDATERGDRMLAALGRLEAGVSLAEARADLGAISRRLDRLYPESNSGWTAEVRPLQEIWMPPAARTMQLAQLGSVAFVLLIVCANVANLILAQANARRQEIAMRAALGAGRWRLIRQHLTESSLLALCGGALGTLLTYWGVALMRTGIPVRLPFWIYFEVNAAVLVYVLAITLVSGLALGLLPALTSSGLSLFDSLKVGGQRGGGKGSDRLRNLLVVSEFAVSLVLLVGALLMVQSFVRLREVNLGYDNRQVLTLQVALTAEAYDAPDRRVSFLKEVLRRINGLADVELAGVVNYLPASGNGFGVDFARRKLTVEGRVDREEERLSTSYYTVSTDYLETVKIPLLKGRVFEPQETWEGLANGSSEINGDGRHGDSVVILSRSLAQQLWPGEEALGRRLQVERRDGSDRWLEVVGIVGDVAPPYQIAGVGSVPTTQAYVPLAEDPWRIVTFAVRSNSEPARLTSAIRQELRSVDASVPIFEVISMERLLERVRWLPRWMSDLFSAFALMALVIASIGAYGVNSYAVSRRLREMGIRLALGSGPRDILMLFVKSGLKLTVIGVVLGLAMAFPLAKVLSSILFDVGAVESGIFGTVVLLLLVVGAMASYLPARRAARIDPVVILRGE